MLTVVPCLHAESGHAEGVPGANGGTSGAEHAHRQPVRLWARRHVHARVLPDRGDATPWAGAEEAGVQSDVLACRSLVLPSPLCMRTAVA